MSFEQPGSLPEETNIKPDEIKTPPASESAPERPKIDVAFGHQVRRYFNERQRIEIGDDDHDAFISENGRTLERLTNPDPKVRSYPSQFTGALAELTGVMGTRNPDTNTSEHSEVRERDKKLYAESKHLFMESYRKVYPDQKKIELSGTEYVTALEKLRGNFLGYAAESMLSAQEYDQMIQDNPKTLVAEIDYLLGGAGDEAKEIAFKVHTGEISKESRKESVDQTTAIVEAIFRLQSLRDQLRTKIYGRSTSYSEEERTDLQAAKERFGFAVSVLRPHLDIPPQPKWNLKDDDLSRWDRVGEKLDLIRREYRKDNRSPWLKKEEFDVRVREAFE